ncbi:MAG: hypothetical protein N2109_04945 [Fimbriimonadales bacterium]|nr:hypothetical protein [Fimbriimonadales bacterium]
MIAGATVVATLGHPISGLFTGTYAAPSGNTLAASALFQTYQSGSTWYLDVLLTNTSTDVTNLVPADTLTGLFFEFGSSVSPTLSPVQAVLPTGVKVWLDGSIVTNHGSNVGGEWAYKPGLSIGTLTGLHGIGSAGFGLFGPHDRFDTSQNLSGPDNPDGLQYGIIPTISSWPGSWNPKMIKEELISNAVLFTFETGSTELTVLPTGVWAQYGTDLDEPRFRLTGDEIPPEGIVPEPASFALAAGAFGLAVWRRRRR